MHKETYYKAIFEGTHYEIGQKQAKYLLKYHPEMIEWLKETPEDGITFTMEEALDRCNLFDEYSKGFSDELKGLADGLHLPLNKMSNILNGYRSGNPCACSVVGISNKKSNDSHAYIAQSYEFDFSDEYLYAIIRPTDSYAHMGFAFYQLARFDGINEKGLCAAITSLEFAKQSVSKKNGFSFGYLVRFILDTCATTREAVKKLKKMPVYTNANIMLGDIHGDIVTMEILTDSDSVSIIERKADPYVYGFNHYISDENKKKVPQKRYFSYNRELFAKSYLKEHELIKKEDLFDMLTKEIPNGLSCPAYSEYFGTLRSILYDLTSSTANVCFGNPQNTPYTQMNLWEEEKIESIDVTYEDKAVDNLFWQIVEK